MINIHNTHQPILDNDSLDGETGSMDGERHEIINNPITNLSIFVIDCPVCLEKHKNFVTLICGHKICNNCELLLIQHNNMIYSLFAKGGTIRMYPPLIITKSQMEESLEIIQKSF